MSTRGTYSFRDTYLKRRFCVYVHHDNYLEGAAHKLYLMHKLGGVSIENFIRANDKSELCESHNSHGDTQFKYTLIDDELRVDNNTSCLFHDKYWAFINDNLNPEWLEDKSENYLIKPIKLEWMDLALTHDQAVEKIEEIKKTLGVWAINGHLEGANAESAKKRYNQLEEFRLNITREFYEKEGIKAPIY